MTTVTIEIPVSDEILDSLGQEESERLIGECGYSVAKALFAGDRESAAIEADQIFADRDPITGLGVLESDPNFPY